MLDEALGFIAADRPSAALGWLDELMQRVRTLPDSGRVVPELQRPKIREVLVAPYRMPYHRDTGQVTILAVLHDRRLFSEGDLAE